MPGSTQRAATLLAAFALTGCPNPNLYTAPRATPVGRVATVLAPQFAKQVEGRPGPALVFGLRVGLAPRLDVGVRSNFLSLAADLKWNVVRTRRFDLALDGGVEVLPYTLYVDLPLLMGINVADDITLLPNTGLTLGAGKEPTTRDGAPAMSYQFTQSPQPSAGRVFLRAGFGIQARLTPSFAMQPEVLVEHLVAGSPYTSDFVVAGLGFCWGRLPD